MNRPCIACGRSTSGSYCRTCDAGRLALTQPYREAYTDRSYRVARRAAFARANGRCEHVANGRRCEQPPTEAHHVVPLSSAPTLAAALELNRPDNLAAVCRGHNPRGGRRN